MGRVPSLEALKPVCEAGTTGGQDVSAHNGPGVNGPARRSLGEDRILVAQSITGRENPASVADKRPSSLLIQMQAIGRELTLTTKGPARQVDPGVCGQRGRMVSHATEPPTATWPWWVGAVQDRLAITHLTEQAETVWGGGSCSAEHASAH